jgi:inner membrane protein
MNLITHAIVGIALSEALMSAGRCYPGATLPDIDYVIGIQHRTITHSLLFIAIVCLLVWRFKGKRTAYALLLGFASHLMLDTITPMGVPLLWPLDTLL